MHRLVIALILIFSTNISAQPDNRVKYGLKGGINFDSYSAKVATSGTEVGGDSAASYYSLIAEVKMSEFDFLNVNATYAITSNVNLIQVPLHYRKILYKRWSAFAGPQFDFIVNDDLIDLDEDVLLKKYSFTLAAGLQKDFGEHWFFELRYSRGITNILEDLGNNLEELKINEFRFGIGYIL